MTYMCQLGRLSTSSTGMGSLVCLWVVPRDDHGTWLVREPTTKVFTSNSIRQVKQVESGRFDPQFQIFFCDDLEDLMKHYFHDFTAEGVSEAFRLYTGSWRTPTTVKYFGLSEDTLHSSSGFVLVKLLKPRMTVKTTGVPQLRPEAAAEFGKIRVGDLNNMLKFAFVVCCAALASAEPEAKAEAKADPALLYGAYAGYPYAAGYAGYSYGYPYAYGLYGKRSADAEPEADAYYYGYARPYAYGYRSYGYPAYGYGYYGKRSADAEPEAEADAYYGVYGYGLGYAGYGLITYAGYGYPAYGYYGKRSADAEPEADADAYYGVYGYGLGYAGYGLRTYAGYGYPAYGYYGKRS